MNDFSPVGQSSLQSTDDLPRVVLRKVTWRLVPFLCLLYICNILDRGNLGFATQTSMLADVGLDKADYYFGYGIFYFGYLVFEVPANLLLHRIGARLWIARIMITWGFVSAATMAVTGVQSFYLVRILLGVAEAGFFPGIILYLTFWFPARERARIVSYFMMASPVAGLLGNPLSGAITQYLDGAVGLKGWQWMFLLEGIPSVVIGIVVLLYLTDRPDQARWLTTEERDWLSKRMSLEDQQRQQRHQINLRGVLTNGRVWLLICIYFTVAVGSNASGAAFPEIVGTRFRSADNLHKGLLLALPSACAIMGMILMGTHSDRTAERRVHLACAAFMGAAGWAVAYLTDSPWVSLAGLCLAQTGMMSMLPIFWAVPTSFLSGIAAAGGIALINSVGNIGGWFGPSIYGKYGLEAMAGILFAGGILTLFALRETTLDRELPPDEESVAKSQETNIKTAESGNT
jgi:MFS transporter, ACS family, tartrate transporter